MNAFERVRTETLKLGTKLDTYTGGLQKTNTVLEDKCKELSRRCELLETRVSRLDRVSTPLPPSTHTSHSSALDEAMVHRIVEQMLQSHSRDAQEARATLKVDLLDRFERVGAVTAKDIDTLKKGHKSINSELAQISNVADNLSDSIAESLARLRTV